MLDFHREMIADEVRTSAYREAIRHFVTPDSVVLDLGTGSGILSLFACDAGARRVYAIESQHIADAAMLLARECGFADRMTVFHEKSFDVTMPEPVDVLVTETIAGFGLEEGMLGSVLDARQRFLKPDAVMIPRQMELIVAAVEHPKFYDENITWWERPQYGFDLSPLRMFTSNSLRHDKIDPRALLSPGATVMTIDFATFDSVAVTGSTQLTVERPGTLHGFAGWFSATLAPGLVIADECGSAMHWFQAFLALERPVAVEKGTTIDFEFQSHDGAMSRWRGTVHTTPAVEFDQMTRLSRPPCALRR